MSVTPFKMLDRHLAGRQFVASDRYTIADIMALVTVNFASRINLAIREDCNHLRRWHETIFGAPERCRLIPGFSSDRLAAACEELIFDRPASGALERRVTCSFAWRGTNGHIRQQ